MLLTLFRLNQSTPLLVNSSMVTPRDWYVQDNGFVSSLELSAFLQRLNGALAIKKSYLFYARNQSEVLTFHLLLRCVIG